MDSNNMIHTVTFSGPDDNTNHEDLYRLSDKYSFIEWGILLSRKRDGSPRYPSQEWQSEWNIYEKQHKAISNGLIKLSGHLCGQHARNVIFENCKWADILINFDWWLFRRFQLNFNANEEPHKLLAYNIKNFLVRLNYTSLNKNCQIIFQIRGENQKYLEDCKKENLNVAGLFDKSGGTGLIPDQWPQPIIGTSCGYAGGLSPENIEEEIKKILEVSKDVDIWIDMESGVRTNDEFDLEKVEKCAQILQKYVK